MTGRRNGTLSAGLEGYHVSVACHFVSLPHLFLSTSGDKKCWECLLIVTHFLL